MSVISKLEDFRRQQQAPVSEHLLVVRYDFFRDRRRYKLTQIGDIIRKRNHQQALLTGLSLGDRSEAPSPSPSIKRKGRLGSIEN